MHFLGLQFDAVSHDRAADLVTSTFLEGRTGTVVIHANLNTAFGVTRDGELRAALACTRAQVLFEGIGLKVAHALTRGRWLPDTNGTDLVPAVLRRLADRPLRVALVGGAAGVAAAAGQAMQREFAHVQLVGAWNGFEDRADEAALLQALREAQPDIVLLGLGTPIQEQLAVRWSEQAGARLTWAVGGLFDYWAGTRDRAPSVWRQLRVEWMWRLLRYPQVYARRYVQQAFWLGGQVLRDWLVASRGEMRPRPPAAGPRPLDHKAPVAER
jgi:N-acetylglucosaminyldiphosphoundecaprenol N-acetyl-beta-D-mannosaminyltransferase